MCEEKNNKSNNNKIIKFPEKQKLKEIKKQKKYKEKNILNAKLQQKALEDKYRAEYRAMKAKELSSIARKSANKNNTPFINWNKIPPFTKYIIGLFILIQIILSIAISPGDKLAIIYNFGFIPAIYSGNIDWNWFAIISPFTSLIIHSNWSHLGFNIAMMVIMGIFFENEFGTKKTAIFFLLSGISGNIAYLLLDISSTSPVIGASGAISGLFSINFSIMIKRGIMGKKIQEKGPLPFIIIWSIIIIVLGIINSDTSWQSHIGGFLGGIIIFNIYNKYNRKKYNTYH